VDIASIVGLLLGLFAIVGGQALEGGHLKSILEPTAAIIVFGGTIGATMISYPLKEFLRGVKMAKNAFTERKVNLPATIEEIGKLAERARKEGIIALESSITQTKDPFLGKALRHLVDGMAAPALRDTLEASVALEEEQEMAAAKVFETAGGFSPTIGIIGAVLGLIHVMENLSDPSKLGGGIATAFVATVYGVGAANLLFLPMASKLKRKIKHEGTRRALLIDGVADIAAGTSPRALREKLQMYLLDEGHGRKAA